MDSNLNKNAYQPNNINRDNEFYGGCMLTNPCGQQSSGQRGQHQHFLPPYPINNTMPHQQLLYNSQGQSMYNIMYGAQPMYRNQNTFQPALAASSFPAPETAPPWVSESCVSVPSNTSADISKEKYMKMKHENKIKDTNAASCCAPLPDVYKMNKNFYYNNKMDTQWFYGSNYDAQKYNELPSCSQISNNSGIRHLNECCVPNRETNAKNIKSVKYCSIQKCPEPDPKLYMYSNKYETHTTQIAGYANQYNNKIPKDYPSCSQIPETCSNQIYGTGEEGSCLEIDKKILLGPCDMGYYPENNTLQPFGVRKLDDKTEDSNGGGESDIVVEDSDEEVTDESEDNLTNIQPPCFVCNTAVTTVDSNEYCVITDKVPLTSYSRSCVSETLITLFGLTTNFVHTTNYSTYLCSSCMALINTYDNLQVQFESVKRDLMNKYKTTIEALKQYIEESEDKRIDNDSIHQQTANHNNQIAVCATSTKMNTTKQYAVRRKICGSHIFKCRVCEKIFSLKKFYKFHMSKHKSRRKSFLCERCGCHFVKHSNLLAHLRRHSSPQKQFKLNCLHCRKSFAYERSLQQHKCNITNMKPSFVCHICGKIIKSSSSLKEHEYDCSGKLAYACDKCNRHFASPSKLNKHILVDHDQKFTVTCSVCGKGFTKHSDYKLHTLAHSDAKSFKCTVCGKTYKTLSNLNYHSKVHNATLPFSCNVCQKGFLRRENLQAHLNIHNGLKPFGCVICEKKFASQKNLDAHLKVHNGSTRKTACTVCGKQIIHGLDEHMRTHSNQKDFQCDSCDMKFYTKGALAKHKKRKHENIDVL